MTFIVTLIPVTVAPAGIPDTATELVTPAAEKSGTGRLTVPEEDVDISALDADND